MSGGWGGGGGGEREDKVNVCDQARCVCVCVRVCARVRVLHNDAITSRVIYTVVPQPVAKLLANSYNLLNLGY